MKTIKLLAMALVACMALCSLPVPLTIPVIPAHTPLPAICAQEAPKAIDLGVCVKWAAEDVGPEADIPEGWRLPTLAEIRELREKCIQSAQEKDGQEWIMFTGKNGNSISFLYPIGSRSAREFGIAGSDGCYLKVTILNPLLKAPGRDGYYSWEELGETDPGQRKYPVRLVKE